MTGIFKGFYLHNHRENRILVVELGHRAELRVVQEINLGQGDQLDSIFTEMRKVLQLEEKQKTEPETCPSKNSDKMQINYPICFTTHQEIPEVLITGRLNQEKVEQNCLLFAN